MRPSLEPTRMLAPTDAGYPPGLHRLSLVEFASGRRWRAPPPLYVRGFLPVAPMLAIVGVRQPAPESVRWTEALVDRLAPEGWAIGSGGAAGIDAAAHRAAVHARAPTVVVTTGGLDGPPYPPEHAALFAEVLEAGGALVSLDPDGVQRDEPKFFLRNQVLAAMSVAVLTVELRPKKGNGGTGHTARAAHALGRRLLTVPHPPWSDGGAGTIAMLRLGAVAVATPDDVLEVLRALARDGPAAPPRTVPAPAPELDEDEQAVVRALDAGPAHLDAVCARTGLPASVVTRALLTSAVHGVVVEGPSGVYARVPS